MRAEAHHYQQKKSPSKKRNFRFKDLFSSINDTINKADPARDNAKSLLTKVEQGLKDSKAYPFLKTVKRHVKNKYIKNKEVKKCVRRLDQHFKDVKHDAAADQSSKSQELAKLIGALLMTTAKTCNQTSDRIVNSQVRIKSGFPDEPCCECFDDIEGDYYRCSQ